MAEDSVALLESPDIIEAPLLFDGEDNISNGPPRLEGSVTQPLTIDPSYPDKSTHSPHLEMHDSGHSSLDTVASREGGGNAAIERSNHGEENERR